MSSNADDAAVDQAPENVASRKAFEDREAAGEYGTPVDEFFDELDAEECPVAAADPEGDPRWQAVRVLARNQAWQDPWTPAAATVEALEAAGLRVVHAATQTYWFDVMIGRPITDDEVDALFEAGCNDCSPVISSEVTALWFGREALSRALAVQSAVAAARAVGLPITSVEDAQAERPATSVP